jgi:hypothetical protein
VKGPPPWRRTPGGSSAGEDDGIGVPTVPRQETRYPAHRSSQWNGAVGIGETACCRVARYGMRTSVLTDGGKSDDRRDGPTKGYISPGKGSLSRGPDPLQGASTEISRE